MKNESVVAESAVWRNCTPGELEELRAQQRRRQQRRALVRGLSLAMAGCAAAGVLGTLWLPMREERFAPGGLVCDEVTRLLPAYVANQLDEKRTEQVRTHLASCEHCTEILKKLQQASSSLQSRSLIRSS